MLTVGQVLQDRYQIMTVLGQGGMGAVFRAFDNRLNKACVVKEMLLTPEAIAHSIDAAEQFKREAGVLAMLRHPNLPVVIDYFIDGGNSYLVMDYVEGQSLQKLIGRKGMPEPIVLMYASQLLDVLEYIHSEGVVHRDIKPANIIIQSNGRLALVDFGLVKMMTPDGSGTKTYLRGVGTPEYAPPEQMKGGTDQRSDIYSLGATLYHALTGKPPSDATDRTVELTMPSVRELSPAVSMRTDNVVQKAMALKRDLRYANAAAMRAELNGKPLASKQRSEVSKTTVLTHADQSSTAKSHNTHTRKPWGLLFGSVIGIVALVAGVTVALQSISGTGTGTVPTALSTDTPRATAIAEISTQQLPTPTAPLKSPTSTSMPKPSGAWRLRGDELVLTLPDGIEIVLVYVPSGEFLMGSASNVPNATDDEKPQHKVMLDKYWISKYEVTNLQYASFAKATNRKWTVPSGKGDHPVVTVNWDDAVAFCVWVSKVSGKPIRLPTEAEWEKAARGTDGRLYPWGNQAPDILLANYNYYVLGTTAIGRYSPRDTSPYGVEDAAGNVWEWTSSLFKAYPYNATDGREDTDSRDMRVMRGGAYVTNRNFIGTTYRGLNFPSYSSSALGFRVAASP